MISSRKVAGEFCLLWGKSGSSRRGSSGVRDRSGGLAVDFGWRSTQSTPEDRDFLVRVRWLKSATGSRKLVAWGVGRGIMQGRPSAARDRRAWFWRTHGSGGNTMTTLQGLRLAAIAAAALVASNARADDATASLKAGKPDLRSAGPLSFGPDGILFVGDTQGAALFAIDTGDRTAAADKAPIKVENIALKVAARLGTDVQKVAINDMAVNPISGKAYLSVSRGLGPDAAPVIVRVGADGKIDELILDNVKFAKTEIPNTPAASATRPTRGGESARSQSITDVAYIDGQVFVAGLSNEDFASRLITMPFPFSGPVNAAGIEIYHGAHGRFETNSPVRTFVAYKIGAEPYLMAAYQCTPLVKIPTAELKPGAHVKGTTIAELGNHNRPLDMIVYQKGGKDFLLLTNNSRGVMKIATEGVGAAPGITSHVADRQGVGYETIETLKGVTQLDKADDAHAVVLYRAENGSMNLQTIDLP